MSDERDAQWLAALVAERDEHGKASVSAVLLRMAAHEATANEATANVKVGTISVWAPGAGPLKPLAKNADEDLTLDVFCCPDCGAQEQMEFDADLLRDRVLEGVMFDVLNIGGKTVVRPKAEDMAYLEQFNLAKLTGEAASRISHNDLSGLYCPKCKEPMA